MELCLQLAEDFCFGRNEVLSNRSQFELSVVAAPHQVGGLQVRVHVRPRVERVQGPGGQCYVLEIIFDEKKMAKMALLTQNCKKIIRNTNFFAKNWRISPKIVLRGSRGQYYDFGNKLPRAGEYTNDFDSKCSSLGKKHKRKIYKIDPCNKFFIQRHAGQHFWKPSF
jgi:hypothetical protein